MKKIITAIFSIVLFAGSASAVEARGFGNGIFEPRVRVLHASPDAPNVDVYVNDSSVLQNVPYGVISDYIELDPGTYNIKVRPAGQDAPIVIDADVNIRPARDYTIAATNVLGEIEPVVYTDRNFGAPFRAKVNAIHLSPNAPEVDVAIVDGPVIFSSLEFQESSGYTYVSPGIYDLEIRLAGTDTSVLQVPQVELMGGNVYQIHAIGLVGSNPSLSVLPAVEENKFQFAGFRGFNNLRMLNMYR